jgi:DNA polymerase-3 subunit alpha
VAAPQDLPEAAEVAVSTTEILWHSLREGWKYRGFDKTLSPADRRLYGDRVKYEMEAILGKDFGDYFAVLGDVVRQAKDQGVAVGPARGSAAASLVCYLLRITEVNPMAYPLMLFERFIDPNRDDVPDIDLDFEDDRRDEVRQIMIRKYGADRVGNIGTFTKYKGKNAIDDVARVYGVPKVEVEEAKEFLVERSGGDTRADASIGDTVEMFPQVKAVFDKYPDLYRAADLEGNYKAFGVHAAGLVIGNEPLAHYVATYGKDNVGKNNNSVQVLSVDKYDGEHLGLMKLDALGLQTMGMIRIALDMLGMTLDELYDIPMDDPKTLAAFERADVTGIFQFEGRTMKMVCEELKPKTFMDLAAVNALARPGPLHSGSTGDYIAIRHGKMKRVDLHPMLTEICNSTEGQIIYQEQILQITRDIGKFPWTHASAIRRIISSKKGESAFNAMWDDFKVGAAQSDIPEPVAAEIWKRMATAGSYAFNIAHCVSYSMLGLWAMWLKVHHPHEFYAAQLHKTPNPEKRLPILRDMKREKFGRDLEILPPLPGVSGLSWQPEPESNGVRAGFMQLPGIGEAKAQAIKDFHETETGGIRSWTDLIAVPGIGPKTVARFEEFGDDDDPFGILKIRRDIAKIKAAIKERELPGVPMPKQTAEDVPYEAVKWRGTIVGLLKSRNLQDIFENHRSRTAEDLDPKTIKNPELKDSVTLYMEDQDGLMTVKVNRFIYNQFKDDVWSAKLNHDYVVATVMAYPFLGKTVHVERLWVIDPD